MNIHFVHCRDLEQRPAFVRPLDCLAANELGDGMKPEQFAQMQAVLRRHAFSKQALRLWYLEKDQEVIAIFETLDVIVRRRTPQAIDLGRGVILGSAFAAPRHRKGYSRHFAGEISRRIASEGYTLLYGIVEASIKIGHEIHSEFQPLSESVWPILDVAPDGVEYVTDLTAWTEPPLVGGFDVLLTPDMLDWRLERVNLQFPQDRHRPIGARLASAWIVWASAYERDALEILHLRADDIAVKSLIEAARHEAAQRGLTRVVAWNNPASRSLFAGAKQQALKDVFALRSYVHALSLSMWLDPQLGHNF